MRIQDLNTNLTDHSVKEFCDELLFELRLWRDSMNTKAMNCYALSYWQGRHEMMDDIIKYFEKVKP